LGRPLFPSHPWCTPLVHGRTREAQDPKHPKPLLGGVQKDGWRGAWGAWGAWGLGPPPLPKPPLGTLPPPNNTAQKELGWLGGLDRPRFPSHPLGTPLAHGRTREAQDPKPTKPLLGGVQEGGWRGALGAWGLGPPSLPKPSLATLPPPNNTAQKELGGLGGLGRPLFPSHPWGTPLVHGRTREAQDPKPPKPLLGGVQEGWWKVTWGAWGAWVLGPPALPKPPLGTLPPPNNTAQKELGGLGGLGRPLFPSHPWGTPLVHGRTREAQDPKPPMHFLGGVQEGGRRGAWGA